MGKKGDGEKASVGQFQRGSLESARPPSQRTALPPTFAFGFGNVGRGTSCSASHTACIEMNCSLGVTMVSRRRHGNYANTAFPREASALKPITIIIIVMVESCCSGEAAGCWEIPPFQTRICLNTLPYLFACPFFHFFCYIRKSPIMAVDLFLFASVPAEHLAAAAALVGSWKFRRPGKFRLVVLNHPHC